MGLAAAVSYVQVLLDGMTWSAGIQALTRPPPPLACKIMPPDPEVTAATPHAYVWFNRGMESRRNDPAGAGTMPRAAYPGAPAGTKSIQHMVPVYVVWTGGSPADPVAASLFPGMVDAIMARLRSSPATAVVTDPWTGDESELVDVGEQMSYVTDLRALEPMRDQRLDALIDCSVAEVITA